MNKLLLFPILTILFSAVLFSCVEDDDFTRSPQARIQFSSDTLDFGTVLCNVPSGMQQLSVYNRNSKAIRLPRISLRKGASSSFKVNVDGAILTGADVVDAEIGARDSMLVYAFSNPPAYDSDNLEPQSDTLIFITEGGQKQQVILRANAQAVVTLMGHHVSQNEVLDATRPYHVMDSLVVDSGATLTVPAGAQLLFHAGARLIVRGTLQVLGEKDRPVVMRGDRFDNMFTNQPYDRIPGQWGGIVFASESYGNYVNFADIHSADFGIQVDSCDDTRETLFLENTVLHNFKGHGLSVRMANVYVGNSPITNAGGDCVRVRGGNVTMVHCTIARFYYFTGGSGVALDFSNYDGGVRLPLHSAQFANCIITGAQSDEIMGSSNPKQEKDAYEYAFFNCLINTTHPEKEDKRLVNCLWDEAEADSVKRDGNFIPDFDLKTLEFNFDLSAKSRAVGHADRMITEQTYPCDPQGRNRLAEGTLPDIGAYQHTENSDEELR